MDAFDGSTNETTYDDDLDDAESSHSRQHIEKSYSNLSKDSGVLADSYHSDYSTTQSNCHQHSQCMILSGVGCCLSASQTKNMPLIGGVSCNASGANNGEQKLVVMSTPMKYTQVDDLEARSCASSSGTEPELSSEESTSATLISSSQQSQPNTTNFALIKQSMAEKKTAPPDIYRTYTKNYTKKQPTDQQHHQHKKSNSNLSLSSIISSSTSTSTTPSPGSSSSGISCSEASKNMPPNPIALPSPVNTEVVEPPQAVHGSNSTTAIGTTPPFFFNYNSLMNVSMLDSIQATNTSLDFDNMSSSILMFN